LGVLYINAWGVTRDYVQARKWFQKAADAGDADAMYNLGVLYQNGQGVARDSARARYWIQKAAEAGNADAKNALHQL
jgi:uncharacterized protein